MRLRIRIMLGILTAGLLVLTLAGDTCPFTHPCPPTSLPLGHDREEEFGDIHWYISEAEEKTDSRL